MKMPSISKKLFDNYFPLIIIIILGFLIVLARVHTYYEPFERDITTYAVIAHEMLLGRELYSDLWDNKPPGIFITYAAAEALIGYGPQSIYLLNVSAAIITLLGVYFTGSAIGGRRGGIWAAICWAIISGNLKLQANQPNVEVFINACLIWAFALFVRTTNRPLGYRKVIVIGLLFALASIYKHFTVVAALLITGIYVLKRPPDLKMGVAFNHALVIAGIGVTTWIFIFGYFALKERFNDFYELIFVYGPYYSGNLFFNLLRGLFNWKNFMVVGGLLGTAVLGLIVSQTKHQRMWLFLITYAVAVQIMISLPGKFFSHYYQLGLPPIAVGIGWILVELNQYASTFSRKTKLPIEKIIGSIVIGVLLYFHLPLYALSPDEWSEKKYGNIFIFVKTLAQHINTLLKADETFFQASSEPGLYFYSQRTPPSGLFFNSHYMRGPLEKKLSQRIIADLEKNKPELITFLWKRNQGHPSQSNQTVMKWIYSRYQWPCSEQDIYKYFHLPTIYYGKPIQLNEAFYLVIRRGGELESRLLKGIYRQKKCLL